MKAYIIFKSDWSPLKNLITHTSRTYLWSVMGVILGVFCASLHAVSAEQLTDNLSVEVSGKKLEPAESIEISFEDELVSLKTTNTKLGTTLTALSKAIGYPIRFVQFDELESTEISVEFKARTVDKSLSLILGQLPAAGYALVSDSTSKQIYIFARGSADEKNADNLAARGFTTADAAEINSAYMVPASEKEVLWLRNHQTLLSVHSAYRRFTKAFKNRKQGEALQLPDFNRWSAALYSDAILAEYLSGSTSDARRAELSQLVGQIPENYDIELLGPSIPSTSKYYPDTLKSLLMQTQKIAGHNIGLEQSAFLANEYIELVNSRKDYSDNYYKTEMRTVLMDDSISVPAKVSYMEPYLQNKDSGLVRYGNDYFENLADHRSLTSEESESVKTFTERVKAELGNI